MNKSAERTKILNDMAQPLAELILEAARVRETSYDAKAARATEDQCAKDGTSCDFDQFYKLTLQQAVEQVCPANLVEPVAMLLRNNWNESLDWAKEVVL